MPPRYTEDFKHEASKQVFDNGHDVKDETSIQVENHDVGTEFQDIKTLLFSFKGKIGKKQFIVTYLSLIVFVFVLFFIFGVTIAMKDSTIMGVLGLLAGLSFLASIWVQFAIMCKRIRDIGKHISIIIFAFIPYVGFAFTIYLMIADSEVHE